MLAKTCRALGAMALVLSSSAALAEDDPNLLLIEARKGEMEVRALNVTPLFAMAKGKMPYDAAKATKYANNLKLLLALDMGDAWAAGTGKDKYAGKTHALPEIWSTYPKVAEAGKEYAAAVEALAAVAGNGVEALQSKIGDVGNGCKGCHDDFREKE
jgi:cytochrome c556